MMKNIALKLAMSAVLSAPAHGMELTIALDRSSSSALNNEHFAEAVAKQVGRRVAEFERGDVVRLNTFGALDYRHLVRRQITVSRRVPAGKAAQVIADEIRAIAADPVRDSATQILAYLEDTPFHCDGNQEIWVVGDGIESSDAISSARLLDGEQKLPPPDASLESCKVTFVGLSKLADGLRPLTRDQKINLKRAWREWMAEAGVAEYRAIVNLN